MKIGRFDSLELSLNTYLKGEGDRDLSALKSRNREKGKGSKISNKL